MVKDERSASLKPFDFEYLLDKIPELGQMDCDIHTDSFDEPIDSSNMKPEHWARLAKRIAQDYDNYDGFVILHGSDTMAYTSSALSFMLQGLSKPVILTGSQLPIGITRSDARENLLTTMEIAIAQNPDGSAKVPEVCVYFEYDLFRGNRIHKMSTEDFEAFQSLNYPKLAEAGVHIKYNRAAISPAGDNFQCISSLSTEVGVLTVFPGMGQEYVQSVLHNPKLKGLVLRTFGAGNAPTDNWFLNLLEERMQKGLYIANVTQCNGGSVEQGKYQASERLKEIGVLGASDMTFEAALTKMMCLLAQDLSPKDFRQAYENELCGEMS